VERYKQPTRAIPRGRDSVPHVFVETNWLFAYAAPAHHQVPAAVDLLERAKNGEFALHMPYLCIGEARQAIRSKCQPRTEADAFRRFLKHETANGALTDEHAVITRTVLDKFESAIKNALDKLDAQLESIAALAHLHTFALDEQMLARCTQLALEGITRDPFDQAILAGIVVSAERLWAAGEEGLSFCEADNDLQPWDRRGGSRPDLKTLYDGAHLWVYGDFTLSQPTRRPGFR
jgi:hypothetical protein